MSVANNFTTSKASNFTFAEQKLHQQGGRLIMKDSELRTRAKSLAIHIIAVCDEVDTRRGRSVLVNQIVRSATSIGANIHEAN